MGQPFAKVENSRSILGFHQNKDTYAAIPQSHPQNLPKLALPF
jgi:hypothetical protein